MTNYFAFTDESGNSTQERFFGLGLLMLQNTGALYDSVKPYYERTLTNAKLIKNKRIKELIKNSNMFELEALSNSSIQFEMKFKNINFSNNLIYKTLINEYFNFKDAMFCCLVKDRNEIKSSALFDPWESYINDTAMLLANNIKKLSNSEICILCDDLSKPANISDTFENRLMVAVKKKLTKIGIIDNLFGVIRLESHASLMIQLVDILLGCVMFDFKLESGLISEKQFERKNIVVSECRKIIGEKTLSKNITTYKPNYFSVWKFKQKK